MQVTMNVAQRSLAPDVLDAKVRQMGFSNCLVHRLVLSNPPLEIALGLLSRHVLVVRISRRDFQGDVGR